VSGPPTIFPGGSEMRSILHYLHACWVFRYKAHRLQNFAKCLVLPIRQGYCHVNFAASLNRRRVDPSFTDGLIQNISVKLSEPAVWSKEARVGRARSKIWKCYIQLFQTNSSLTRGWHTETKIVFSHERIWERFVICDLPALLKNSYYVCCKDWHFYRRFTS